MAEERDGADAGGTWMGGAYVLPAREGEREAWKAFRYRLYPKPDQVGYFNKLFGCCRYVYNHFLEVRIRAWEAKQADPDVRIPTWVDMSRELTRMKREVVGKDGTRFLREVDATALVNELRHLDAAFAGFFRRARAGKGAPGFPRFKGKRSKRSATVSFENPDYIGDNRIRFAKLGWIYANIHRPIEGKPVSLTVSQDASGRWWASIKCKDVVNAVLPENPECIGVSLGDEPIAVTSDGEVLDLPEPNPQEARRLARERRKLARRGGPERNRRSSKRYEDQRLKVAKLYAREADRRADALNNITSDLVEYYGTIVVRNAGQAELQRQLRYKCEWAGRAYVELPRPKASEIGEPQTPEERAKQAKRDLQEGLALLKRAQALESSK